VISSWGGDRGLPYVFSEQGVAMLSSVLNSKKAILVNIQIMRAFTRLRKIFLTHQDLQIKIEKLLRQQIRQAGCLSEHGRHISTIFDAIKQLLRNDAEIKKYLTYTEKKEKNKKWGFQPPERKK
jgi:DNA-binding TFAR19-related protein (PDSD5 family)